MTRPPKPSAVGGVTAGPPLSFHSSAKICGSASDSDHAIVLQEASYPPVVYFPREDVAMEYMSRTDRGTNCPYKGDASYFTLHMDGQFICSGLVARATEKYIEAYPRSPENMMPGDLAFFWGASSQQPLPALGFLGQALNLLVSFVDLFRRRRGDPAPDPGHPGLPAPGAAPPVPAIEPGDRERSPLA